MRPLRVIALHLLLCACTDKSTEADDDDDGTTGRAPEGSEPGDCSDGADNDIDGDFDCDDDACADAPECVEAPAEHDVDGDGFDSLASGGTDCDDADEAVNPAADELCNAVDDDCDGLIDEEPVDGKAWYTDDDGDTYGDPELVQLACEAPADTVDNGEDCDDADPAVHPEADEVCNAVDDDCDDRVDEEPVDGSTWYADTDGDGFGDPETGVVACVAPAGTVADPTDCDDGDDSISPAATERCNGIDDDCDTVEDGWVVPGDFSTIQDAIDGASVGALICVGPGTWFEHLDYGGKDVRVVAEDGPLDTILDGSTRGGPVLRFDSGESTAAELSGFTIEVAELSMGGAVYIDSAGATLQEIVLSNQTDLISDNPLGGLIHVSSGSLVLRDASVQDNAISLTSSSRTSIHGAFVYLDASTAHFSNVVLSGNTSEIEASGGAGLYGAVLRASGSDLTMEGVSFTDNRGTSTAAGGDEYGAGGAVYLDDGSTLNLEDALFDGNHIGCAGQGNYCFADGGALYAETSDLSLTDVEVTHNTVDGASTGSGYGNGGGLFIYAGDTVASHLVVADNAVSCTTGCFGGGMVLYPNTVAELTNLVVAANRVDTVSGYAYGGGIHVQVSDLVTITNADIVANTLVGASAYGGGLRTTSGSDIVLTNVNVVENTVSGASAHGSALFQASSIGTGSLSITYGNVFGNAGGSSDFFDATDPTGTAGNISVDPGYTDASDAAAARWDLSLGTGSDCIDAGDPAVVDADGSASDIGSRGGPDASW